MCINLGTPPHTDTRHVCKGVLQYSKHKPHTTTNTFLLGLHRGLQTLNPIGEWSIEHNTYLETNIRKNLCSGEWWDHLHWNRKCRLEIPEKVPKADLLVVLLVMELNLLPLSTSILCSHSITITMWSLHHWGTYIFYELKLTLDNKWLIRCAWWLHFHWHKATKD
jgi:hypothetical protein